MWRRGLGDFQGKELSALNCKSSRNKCFSTWFVRVSILFDVQRIRPAPDDICLTSCTCFVYCRRESFVNQMTSVASNPMDFEEEAKKAREYYMCKIILLSLCTRERFFPLDGEYSKGITFYKLAIDKLRRYCQTVSNAAEKKRGSDVRTQQ